MTSTPAALDALVSRRARSYIHTRWGDRGVLWLDTLPARVAHIARAWDLDIGEALKGGRSCVLAVKTAKGHDAVLKISVERRWAERETIAMRHWAAVGFAPAVLASDRDALLMDCVQGRNLTRHDKDQIGHVARLIATAARAEAPSGVPKFDPVRAMAASARHAGASLPDAWGWKASDIATALMGSGKLVLCHADLVPANILMDDEGRLCFIDPEPRLAPVAFDLALWAFRFGDGDKFDNLAAEAASNAGVPEYEVRAWGQVHAYMHCAWRRKDRPKAALDLAARLDPTTKFIL